MYSLMPLPCPWNGCCLKHNSSRAKPRRGLNVTTPTPSPSSQQSQLLVGEGTRAHSTHSSMLAPARDQQKSLPRGAKAGTPTAWVAFKCLSPLLMLCRGWVVANQDLYRPKPPQLVAVMESTMPHCCSLPVVLQSNKSPRLQDRQVSRGRGCQGGGFWPHHTTNLGEEGCRGRLRATAGRAAALLGQIDEGARSQRALRWAIFSAGSRVWEPKSEFICICECLSG